MDSLVPKFTPEEATKAIFGKDSYEVVKTYDPEEEEFIEVCEFQGIARSFLNCLVREINRDEVGFCLILGGEKMPNPLNTLSNYQARFSRVAYYSWWVSNPHGIACPEWFEDYADRDGIMLGELPPSFEVLSERRKIFDLMKGRNLIVQDRYECFTNQINELKAKLEEYRRGDNSQIVDGLSVADVRKMCEHSAPLKSILVAAAKWHNIPNGNQQKRDEGALESRLNRQAKEDGWGTALNGGVAKDDLRVLVRYVTGNVKGRGQK